MDMANNTFYTTTPIYYPSGKFHIGTAYTTIFTDVLARYNRLKGKDVRFLTGLDEHGNKIQTVAEERGLTPQKHVDEMADEAKELWKLLKISNDDFIRTTEERHKKVVKRIFEKFIEQGDIYLGNYEGLYCKPCESFYTETQLVDGKCPDCGREVDKIKEESYFFKMSNYVDRLVNLYEKNPKFISPEFRKKEIINNFIKPGLEDLCVSRTTFDWGISVDSNPKHVIYVWIDALTNYITALGYDPDGNHSELFNKFWPANVQVVGKDIIRFHTIYWPIMLMALGLEVPEMIYAHGFFMMKDGKMSKSKGNVIYPEMIVNKYGNDALRYYLLRELPYGQDGVFTPDGFVARYNADLANDLGNLLNRTVAMIDKYFDGEVPEYKGNVTAFDSILKEFADNAVRNVENLMDEYKVPDAMSEIWNLVSRSNKYIDETMPWVLAKDEAKKEELGSVMYHLAESLRVIATMVAPILLDMSEEMYKQLGVKEEARNWNAIKDFGTYKFDKVQKGIIVFNRLDVNEEIEYIRNEMSKTVKKPVQEVKEEDYITFDDFSKVDMKVGKVLECEKHPDADKLLVSKVEVGEEVRQIVSGISKFYSPEDMIGKKVVVVTNLKPAKLRGVMSEGMILAAGDGKKSLSVVEIEDKINTGEEVC
ncbi:MAG: methionine--tRNA ligase [Clostridia bacterium]|nr:methionine--tRNA ligase [Clostridia bacterium]